MRKIVEYRHKSTDSNDLCRYLLSISEQVRFLHKRGRFQQNNVPCFNQKMAERREYHAEFSEEDGEQDFY